VISPGPNFKCRKASEHPEGIETLNPRVYFGARSAISRSINSISEHQDPMQMETARRLQQIQICREAGDTDHLLER
jgi:hypothetical protein